MRGRFKNLNSAVILPQFFGLFRPHIHDASYRTCGISGNVQSCRGEKQITRQVPETA
jgi:hypothetical protein